MRAIYIDRSFNVTIKDSYFENNVGSVGGAIRLNDCFDFELKSLTFNHN